MYSYYREGGMIKMTNKTSKKLLIAAFFCVIGVLLGMFAKYYSEHKEVYYGLEVGSTGSIGTIPLTGPSSVSSMTFSTVNSVALMVTIDRQDGYSLKGENGAKEAVKFYKDYLPTAGDMNTPSFYVIPQYHLMGGNVPIEEATVHNGIPSYYGWYDSSSRNLCWQYGTDLNNAHIGWNLEPANVPGGVFRQSLTEKFNAGGMEELKKWPDFYKDDEYKVKCQQLWRYFAGPGTGEGVEQRIREYMGVQDLDMDKVSDWTDEQREAAFISYLDLLLTCRFALSDASTKSQVWTDIINSYINEGPTAEICNYNMVISPAMVCGWTQKEDIISGNARVIVASNMDWFNWLFYMQKENDLSIKTGDKLLADVPNTGGSEGLRNQLNTLIKRNHNSLGVDDYPAMTTLHALLNLGFNAVFNKATMELEGGMSTGMQNTMWLTGEAGEQYFGKLLVLALPLAEPPAGLKTLRHHFRVYWANDGGNYFQTEGSNVNDTVAFVINLDCDKEELPAWEQICNNYQKFYLSFNLRSTGAQHRVTENTKDGGVTSSLNSPSFAIDGSTYTIGEKVEVSKETLRSLIKGETSFIRLYDKSTNTQVINMGELQNFGYDLNVIVHYGNESGSVTNSYDTGWTGWSLDTGELEKQKDQHEVSVYREEENPEKIRWYSSPEAYSEIKEGTVDYEAPTSHEAFEAMAGVPSTEMLYFASGGSEFIVELELERVEGEYGYRRYQSYFFGTECEFKHNDGFWKMETRDGTQQEKEDPTDTTIKEAPLKTPNENLQTGEMIIEKFLVADEIGYDTQRQANYGGKTPVQWYKWAIAGTGNGSHGTKATVTQNETLNGHTHAWDHTEPVRDRDMAPSTVQAQWTGIIWNKQQTKTEQAPSSTHISGYDKANPAPSCKGGKDGKAGDFAESDTEWDVSGYHSAVDQAIAWAKAYEATNDTYTAKMLADSDGYTRVWRIGKATIEISFSGGISNQGSGSRPAGTYTSDTAATAKKPGDQPSFGYNFSFAHGIDGTSGKHGDSAGPPSVPHGEDSNGTDTVGSTVTGVGDITYTIKVTFENNTLDAHELCGTCCQHELDLLSDYWLQKMQYDYARLNVCRVYKIHRSYLEGGELDDITFADYNSGEDSGKDAIEHLMYSGPINNYTVDTGAFGDEDRFFSLGVKDKNRARAVINAQEQSKLHNGTDTIVAAVNQGDPNIFYNIAMMMNIQDSGLRSYAEEVEAKQPSMMNSLAGRVRYSFMANTHHEGGVVELTQHGDYTGYDADNMDSSASFPKGLYGNSEYMGTRSSKCDGMTETVGTSNQIKVVANGHAKPTVSVGGEGNKWFDMFNAGKSRVECKNFSNGLTYMMYDAHFHTMNPKYYDASTLPAPRTFWTEYDKTDWYITDDEYWMGVTTEPDNFECTTLVSTAPTKVEIAGGGVLSGGKYEYTAFDKENNATTKTKYTANSIDAIDYQTEEYHRFRYRRNMRNTIYVISDMLILQTSSGDQPVLYHWKSQTKRLQQHYDYTIADVDPIMAQFDSTYTNNNITLTETLDDMWYNQLNGQQHTKANGVWNSAVTRTVNGWKSNNVGTKQGINVGGYLGLYDQPDRKYSTQGSKYKVATLYDMLNFNTFVEAGRDDLVNQGNDYAESREVLTTFNELAVRWPTNLDYYYESSPMHSVKRFNGNSGMDFGGNKYSTAQYYDGVHTGYNEDGFSFTGAVSGVDKLWNSFSYHGNGPSMVWRYETTIDNPNPDMYKATPNAMFTTGFSTGGAMYARGAEWRMDSPTGPMRIVTDKIQMDPTNPNKEYDTGEATQTYMKILDWPARDIGNMNYVDSYVSERGGADRYAGKFRKVAYKKKFRDELINVVDDDTANKRNVSYESLLEKSGANFGSIVSAAHASVNKNNTYTTMMGYKIAAPYSKTHSKINNIVIHTPVSVQNAVLVHNAMGEKQGWYADTRTALEDITATSLSDKLAKLEVCSGDPDTCEFRTLKCVYPENEVVFSTDFDTGVSNGGRRITNLAATDENGLTKYIDLPSGFTIESGIITQELDEEEYLKTGIEKYKNVSKNVFNSGNYLACFGTRWSLPLSGLKIDSTNTKQIDVDMDFYMDNRKTRGTMVVSFQGFDFYIPNGIEQGVGTFNTGNGLEKSYPHTQLYDNRVKMTLRFNFADATDTSAKQTLKNSELYINGKLVTTGERVNNSNLTIDKIFGSGGYLNIGSWLIDDNYPAQFYIDNLKITKIASERVHQDYCYAYIQEHEVGQSYTCDITYSWKHGDTYSPEGTHITDRPYIFSAPQTGVYKVEAWGGAGGGSVIGSGASHGGAGGYSQGYITLMKDEQIFIYPGGAGSRSATQTTGKEYCWILTDGCGNYANFAANATGTVSGVNYTNSVTGKVEKTNWTAPCIWSDTLPSGYTCGNHSVSVAIDSNTGQMVQRVSGAASGSTDITFGYTGGPGVWTAPATGTYTFEVAGASKGSSNGGKVSGTYNLTAGQKVYYNIGATNSIGGGDAAISVDFVTKNASQMASMTGGNAVLNGNVLSLPDSSAFYWGPRITSTAGHIYRVDYYGNNLDRASFDTYVYYGSGNSTMTNNCTLISSNITSTHTTHYWKVNVASNANMQEFRVFGGNGVGLTDSKVVDVTSGYLMLGGGASNLAASCTCSHCGDPNCPNYCSNHRYACADDCPIHNGGRVNSNYISPSVTNGKSEPSANTGAGYVKITRKVSSNANTWAGAGFNGGGSSGVNGYGGGGGSDIRRISGTTGGQYILNTQSKTGLNKYAKNMMYDNGTLTYGPYDNAAIGTYQVDIYGRGLSDCTFDVYDNAYTRQRGVGGTKTFVDCPEMGWLGTDGNYHLVVFDPENQKTITLDSTHEYIIGYHNDGCGNPGSKYYPNNWAHIKDMTTNVCVSCGHNGCAFDTTKYPSWTLNLKAEKINTRGDKGFIDNSHVIYTHDELLDMKVSPTHVSFYFNLPVDCVAGGGKGLEVRINHANSSNYRFDAEYISRLEDRIIVAGGGGGADDGGGTINGDNDGSGGAGGGNTGGKAKCDGIEVTPGVALTTDLQATVNTIKNSAGAWKAIQGVNRSGCGLGGSQDYGYEFGRGENVSYTTDTGGAGGGWYGGYVTNHNNGGAGGGSGYISGQVEQGNMSSGVNTGEGMIRLSLVAHENETTYQQAWGCTGKVQDWTVPEDGEYRLELWGAQGGRYTAGANGGKGGYSSAVVKLRKNEVLHLYVGQMGYSYPQNHDAGTPFNGGGQGYGGGGDGGGATDIRYGGTSLSDRIIVAGGGGGSDNRSIGGVGGNETGAKASGTVETAGSPATGGTQKSGGSGGGAPYGYGGSLGSGGGAQNAGHAWYWQHPADCGYPNARHLTYRSDVCSTCGHGCKTANHLTPVGFDAAGGGGGYYGGAGGFGGESAGGGGSSYINSKRLINGVYISGGKMLSGAENQPSKSTKGATQLGNTGNGAIRITKIDRNHNATCTYTTSTYNVHHHNINCFYEENTVNGGTQINTLLISALNELKNGDDRSISVLVGSTAWSSLRNKGLAGMSTSAALTEIAKYIGSSIPETVGGYLNPIFVCNSIGFHSGNLTGFDKFTESLNTQYNAHECSDKCNTVNKVLRCTEPHHNNSHYETADDAMQAALVGLQNQYLYNKNIECLERGQEFTKEMQNEVLAKATKDFNDMYKDRVWHSCYQACNDDEKHRKTHTTIQVGDKTIGTDYINTDEYFDIYFPNTGDFAENPSLHGIRATTKVRGMGYENGIDTGKFEYPQESQNYVEVFDRNTPESGAVSWVRERYVKFSFDSLFYRAETGVWEEYEANTWIELPVEGWEDNIGLNRANNSFDDIGDDPESHFYARVTDKTKNIYDKPVGTTIYSGHPRYHFYCLMNNNEQASATIQFESEAINCDNSKGKYAYKDNYGYTGDWVIETITGDKLYQKQRDRNDRVVYNKVSNHNNDNDNQLMDTNKARRANMTSLHGAHITKYADVVGRIGNIAITSTTDIRFANLFKRINPNGTYLINGVVMEVLNGIQRDYLSWHYNTGALAYDVRHRVVSARTAMYNTWGSVMWKGATSCNQGDSTAKENTTQNNIDNRYEFSKSENNCDTHAADVVAGHNIAGSTKTDPSRLPLSSDRNNLNIYRNELLKPGYTINYEITTTGNYQNKLQIKPYFYLLDLDSPGNAKVIPIDIWMKTDDEYKAINFFGATDGKPLRWSDGTTSQLTDENIQEMLNTYILDLDWKNEKDLRMFTQMEEKLTKAIQENYWEYVYAPGQTTGAGTPQPITVPTGDFFKLGNLQSQEIGKQARTFIGTRYTMYENFRHTNGPDMFSHTTISNEAHDTNVWDKLHDLEFTYQTQRWHLKLGLPSSAVFTIVENGVHYHPLTEKMVDGKKVKAFEEVRDGNYAIVMTANIKAMGDVWNLYYTQSDGDRTKAPTAHHNGVVKLNNKTYTFNTSFYEYTTGELDDSQVVLALYDNNTTSEVDVDTISTH